MLHNCPNQHQGCLMFVSGFTKHSGLPEDCLSGTWNIQNYWRLFQGFTKQFRTVYSFLELSEATSVLLDICFMALRNIQDFPKIVSVVPETFRTFEDCFRVIRNILKLSEVYSELSEATLGMLNVCFRDSEILLNLPKQYQRLAMFVSLIYETFKIFEDCFRVFRITSKLSKVVWEPFRSNIWDARCLFQGFTIHFRTFEDCFWSIRNILKQSEVAWELSEASSGMLDVSFSALRIIQDFPIIVSVVPETFRTFEDCFWSIRNILKLS